MKDKRKKIIISSFRGFGIYNSRINLIKKLRKNGWDVYILAKNDIYLDSLKKEGFNVYVINFTNNPFCFIRNIRNILKITSIINELKPRIIHAFNLIVIINFCISSFFLFSFKPSFFFTITGLGRIYKYLDKNMFFNIFIKILLKCSEKVIFQNNEDLKFFKKKNLIHPDKILKVNGSGVDLRKFADFRNSEKKDIKIAMISRLIKEKGIYDFIEVAKNINNLNPEIKIYMIGEYIKNEKNYIDPYIFEKYSFIRYKSHIKSVPSFLKNTDIFLYPSLYREGIPRILLEALAMKVPVIAYDIPGVNEAIINEYNGFLINGKDLSTFNDKVDLLIKNKNKRIKFGEMGRKHIIKYFNMDDIDDFMLNQYSKYITGKN